MSSSSDIGWTDATWNPITGCSRVSAGCDHCYAVTMTRRLESMGREEYAGLTVLNRHGDRHFNGVIKTHEDRLSIPFHWRKPRMVFVNSMSDLFHRKIPADFIDQVFAVMALCDRHTFQVLTKRPERMAEYLAVNSSRPLAQCPEARVGAHAMRIASERGEDVNDAWWDAWSTWPMRHIWLGTSIENQSTADDRIPYLLGCPAAVRFLSCEPLLGEIDLQMLPTNCGPDGSTWFWDCLRDCRWKCARPNRPKEREDGGLDWVIVGCESGPKRRPMKLNWVRSIRDQCASAGVPLFVKQLPINGRVSHNPAEWPSDLRIQNWPKTEAVGAFIHA